MPAPHTSKSFAKDYIDTVIRDTLDTIGRKPRWAFNHLLLNVQARSELLQPSRHAGHFDPVFLVALVRGLRALIGHHRAWRRPIEAWQPSGCTAIAIFSSLAHHLLADYPVPPVLLSAWFQGATHSARRKQSWFCHVGRGGSLRTAGFPIALNRKMAHLFARAPADFPIEFALRWAQVRGLGGSDALARAVAEPPLGRGQGDRRSWIPVIQFLINHPSIGPAHVALIVDFLYHGLLEQQRATDDAEIATPVPQPSLKGWSTASLLRRVDEWQAQRRAEALARQTAAQRAEWKAKRNCWVRSSIGEFCQWAEPGRAWTIRELLDSDQLIAEGQAMSHCVAGYRALCAQRTSTIWSLGIETATERERFVTIEVNPERRAVIQAKARFNAEPEASSLAILKLWAHRECLTLEI